MERDRLVQLGPNPRLHPMQFTLKKSARGAQRLRAEKERGKVELI
jgi:hypothetical protein